MVVVVVVVVVVVAEVVVEVVELLLPFVLGEQEARQAQTIAEIAKDDKIFIFFLIYRLFLSWFCGLPV